MHDKNAFLKICFCSFVSFETRLLCCPLSKPFQVMEIVIPYLKPLLHVFNCVKASVWNCSHPSDIFCWIHSVLPLEPVKSLSQWSFPMGNPSLFLCFHSLVFQRPMISLYLPQLKTYFLIPKRKKGSIAESPFQRETSAMRAPPLQVRGQMEVISCQSSLWGTQEFIGLPYRAYLGGYLQGCDCSSLRGQTWKAFTLQRWGPLLLAFPGPKILGLPQELCN